MSISFVLGNGQSRQNIDLDLLKQQGRVFGCNALYRTFSPDVLVSTDTPISRAIQESGYSLENTHYTRRPLTGLGAKQLPKKTHGWSSGPNALYLASLENPERIYALGFDLGGGERFNNLYADTEFYKRSDEGPTTPVNWIRQFGELMKEFPHIRYIRVLGDPSISADVRELHRYENYSTMHVRDFSLRINTQKES